LLGAPVSLSDDLQPSLRAVEQAPWRRPAGRPWLRAQPTQKKVRTKSHGNFDGDPCATCTGGLCTSLAVDCAADVVGAFGTSGRERQPEPLRPALNLIFDLKDLVINRERTSHGNLKPTSLAVTPLKPQFAAMTPRVKLASNPRLYMTSLSSCFTLYVIARFPLIFLTTGHATLSLTQES
jgi:hypothetical protein